MASAISRSVLSDQIKDLLLQDILTGGYPPGSRIVETRVARQFGISQGPVREALRDLEALGIVEINPFRGASVRRPTARELLEAYGVRAVLESYGARMAVRRVTDANLIELERYIDEMERSALAGDAHTEAAADARFHGRIIELARNVTLERVWKSLDSFSRTYITMVARGSDIGRIPALHRPILEALRRRDGELAAAELTRHLTEAGAVLARHWAEIAGPDIPEPRVRRRSRRQLVAIRRGGPSGARPSLKTVPQARGPGPRGGRSVRAGIDDR